MNFLNNELIARDIITSNVKSSFELSNISNINDILIKIKLENNSINELLNNLKKEVDNSSNENISFRKGSYIGNGSVGNTRVNIGIDFNLFILVNSDFSLFPSFTYVDLNSIGPVPKPYWLMIAKGLDFNNLTHTSISSTFAPSFTNNSRKATSIKISILNNNIIQIAGPTNTTGLGSEANGIVESNLPIYSFSVSGVTYYWMALKF